MSFEEWCYGETEVSLSYERLYKLAQDIYKENSLSREEMQRLLEKLLDQKEIQDKLENMKQYKEEMEKLRREYREALEKLDERREKLQNSSVQESEYPDTQTHEYANNQTPEDRLREAPEKSEASKNQEMRGLNEEIRDWENNYKKKMSETERRFKREAKEKLLKDLAKKLLDKGIVWKDDRGKYEVNKVKVAEILAKKVFEETMKLIKGMGEKKGRHESQKFGNKIEILDRTRKARRLSHRIAFLPTLRNSLIRRTRDKGGPFIDEEDLVEFSHFREVPYSVVFAIDTSGSMAFAGKIEGARGAALSFAYYIRKKYKKDRVQFVEFNEGIKEVCFEELPNLGTFLNYGYRPFTHTGDCLKFVMDSFKEEKGYEKLLYLITDGLPQRNYGNDEEYRIFTLKQAKLLKSQGIHFVEIFLNTNLTVKDLMKQFWHSSYLWSTPFNSCPPDYILRFWEKKMAQDLKLFEYWGRKIADSAQGLFFRIEDPKKLGTFFLEDYTKRRGQGLGVRI